MDDQQETKPLGLIVWAVAALLFVVTLVIIVIALGPDSPTTTPSAEPSSEPPTPEPSPTPELPALASGQDEDLVFEVVAVERGIPTINSREFTAQAQGVYTLVTVRVKNVGDEPLGFFLSDIKGVDSWGRVLENDTQASMFVNDGMGDMVVPAGSVTKVVVFDVLDGANLTAVVATGSSPGSVVTEGGVDIPLP